MTAAEITKYLTELNDELRMVDIKGEISLYGGAVINTYMLKEIPMSRTAYGLGFTLLNLFVGLPSILVAASIVRWGIRKTFGIGSALILIGALWLSLIAARPWHYWVGFGVLTATGISFGTIVSNKTFAVFVWVQSTGVNINIGVKFLNGYF